MKRCPGSDGRFMPRRFQRNPRFALCCRTPLSAAAKDPSGTHGTILAPVAVGRCDSIHANESDEHKINAFSATQQPFISPETHCVTPLNFTDFFQSSSCAGEMPAEASGRRKPPQRFFPYNLVHHSQCCEGYDGHRGKKDWPGEGFEVAAADRSFVPRFQDASCEVKIDPTVPDDNNICDGNGEQNQAEETQNLQNLELEAEEESCETRLKRINVLLELDGRTSQATTHVLLKGPQREFSLAPQKMVRRPRSDVRVSTLSRQSAIFDLAQAIVRRFGANTGVKVKRREGVVL